MENKKLVTEDLFMELAEVDFNPDSVMLALQDSYESGCKDICHKKLAKNVALYTTAYLVGFSIYATVAVFFAGEMIDKFKSKKMTNVQKNSEN